MFPILISSLPIQKHSLNTKLDTKGGKKEM